MYCLGWLTAWFWLKDRYKAHQLIYPFAFAFTGVFASVFASVFVGVVASVVASAGASAGAITGAIAGAIAVTVAGTGAVAGAIMVAGTIVGVIAFAVAGMLFIAQYGLQSLSKKKQKEGFFWLGYSVIFIALAAFLIINSSNDAAGVFLLFYLLFPLLNALIDWLSLGITRGLLQSIRHEHHGGWYAFAWALLDVVLAFGFLLLVSAVLVIAMGLVDSTMLHTALNEINQEATAKNYYWVYAMLLTTLIPTLIPTLLHFALATSALTLWLPQTWRHRIANNLQHNHYKLLAASTYLTITPFIGVLAPVALLYGLYELLIAHGGWLAKILLNWAEMLAGLF